MEVKEMNYEESMEKLEEIIKDLESDQCSLEKTIEKFKMGMDLYEHSVDLLTKAEGEIKILLDGEEEIDFQEVEDGF